MAIPHRMLSPAQNPLATTRHGETPGGASRSWFPQTLALLSLALVVYIPSYSAGFIWDDDIIAGHPLMKEGWRGLRDIWFSVRYGDFCPITATSFWIEWQIHGGMKPIQHATNIFLQACNAVLLWRVLLNLRIPGAWMIAAVFAVHPVCVASVTWLAERKNTLSMFFYLSSLLLYLRCQTAIEPSAGVRIHKGRYWMSFVLFLLGLLSKSSVVVLPVVMLLCTWWREGRVNRDALKRTFPFFGFAFATGTVTLVAHFYFGPKFGVLPTGDNGFTRLLTASIAFWFYAWTDLFPVGLTMHYPRWIINPASPLAYLPGICILATLALLWRFRRTWGRSALFGIAYFIVALGPTIGVVNMAFLMVAPVADHLQYLALPGALALMVGGAVHLLQRWLRSATAAAAVIIALVICPFSILSWQHQRVMANAELLWRDNLKKNPDSWIAHNNLGGIAFERGHFEEALQRYESARKNRDNLSMVHVNVGRSLFALGRTEEAIVSYTEALRLDPTDFKAHNNLGVAFVTSGKTNEAIAAFRRAVELVPTDRTFFANLAGLLLETGDTRSLIEVLRDRVQRAPADAEAHHQLASLLFAEGKTTQAEAHYAKAVQLSPEFIEARFGYAEVLARRNDKGGAIAQWREILKLKPDAVQVLANLAWALATDPNDHLRNGSEAVVLAERVCAVVGEETAAYLDLLAAAYAEAGRFVDAVKSAEKAVSLAESNGPPRSADKYRLHLDLYRSGKPFRTP